MRRPLTNTFDIATLCFVCEPRNPVGLRQQFYVDEDGRRVVADFTPAQEHSGAPNFAHGGVSMALLDEAMAWAVIAVSHRFGMTRRAEIEFLRPVRIGNVHHISAWLEDAAERRQVARAELRDAAGNVCVSARADYTVITIDEARVAVGDDALIPLDYVAPSKGDARPW